MGAATEVDKMAALATAANEARGLAMDSIAAAHSGHMGLPLGCAEIGSVLYGSQVRAPSSISDAINRVFLLRTLHPNLRSCRYFSTLQDAI